MVFCVQAQLAFSSAARRDAVLADIQSRISTRNRWDVTVLETRPFRFGANGLYCEARFTTRADADDLNSRVQSFATGVRTPLAGSWLTVHDCTHDEGTNSCSLAARRDW